MKIGVLGAGKISRLVAPALVSLPEITCYAVASQTPGKAEAFAKEFGFEKVYASYEEMLSDPEVELAYVATPHSLHYEHMMLCLEHSKHVICEKAFTMNAEQSKKVFAAAKARGLYAAEAIWTRYMPSRKMIQDLLDSGVIGKPNTLTANLSYVISGVRRIYDPALAGGALLDIGVYGLNFALMHFGSDIVRVESSVAKMDTGVDGMETITLHYRDGRMAVLTHSVYCRSDRMGIIHGDKGYLVVENINNPQSIQVFDGSDNVVSRYAVPEQVNGYEYEFREAVRCIGQGKLESDSMPHADTLKVIEMMDSLRKSWGIVYPQER
ncbi:MAG: Gfo/Idh/MocA family oxidoreductase [Eubacteriales bacterium]|nr:Gfo/Idh/MocA family oxidoreductase [Eubacteriales bacterium]